jgi:hypothetical protein
MKLVQNGQTVSLVSLNTRISYLGLLYGLLWACSGNSGKGLEGFGVASRRCKTGF